MYEIGRDFRNEGVDRTHNPEFTQLEFYWAYADYQKVMGLTEELVRYVAQEVTGGTTISYQGMEVDLAKPWARIELSDGVAELAGIDLEDYPDAKSLADAMKKQHKIDSAPGTPRGKLIDTLVGEFLEPTFVQPTFLYNYPRDISPLAKNIAGNPDIVERFEGFMAGMELCNAFTELNDPVEQEKRFMEMGRAYDSAEDDDFHPMDDDYLRAMRYGMPPNGGFGIGIDRLVMLLTDQANIREVILFPHLRSRDEDKDDRMSQLSPDQAFQRLAELVNQLPEEERTALRVALGNYTHDLKHTLGLVTGANALLSRIAADQPQIMEMAEIIQKASGQIDELDHGPRRSAQ